MSSSSFQGHTGYRSEIVAPVRLLL